MPFSFQFVALTQPINALAFVFDGVNYGASDFAYSAYSMVNYEELQELDKMLKLKLSCSTGI